jgi:hypothetical protein
LFIAPIAMFSGLEIVLIHAPGRFGLVTPMSGRRSDD